jgi:hypothetical protein
MSGSISLSLSQQFDSLGKPLAGGKLYTYAAGTTTPQSAFQDTGLVQALSNPVILDAAGRVPQLFFADGNIKILLTDVNGVTQLSADNILVIGPSASGGGGATTDPTTVLQTGWIQPIYGTGNVTGFVRANGRTMGNASSGGTERANADTSALFTFLYNADANLAVSGGRGASAAVDYAANKTIALPDWRGRALAGLDDMGNSAAGRLTATYFGTAATALGAASTTTDHTTLQTTNLPPYTPSGLITPSTIAAWDGQSIQEGAVVGTTFVYPDANHMSHAGAIFAGTAQGGTSTPFANVPPMMLATIYLKL